MFSFLTGNANAKNDLPDNSEREKKDAKNAQEYEALESQTLELIKAGPWRLVEKTFCSQSCEIVAANYTTVHLVFQNDKYRNRRFYIQHSQYIGYGDVYDQFAQLVVHDLVNFSINLGRLNNDLQEFNSNKEGERIGYLFYNRRLASGLRPEYYLTKPERIPE